MVRKWRETREGEAVWCRAGTGEAAARLRRTAAVLRSCPHPGLVRLVAVDDAGDEVVVATAEVAGPTLEDARLDVAAGLAVVASVASVVADLHDLGMVHGALAPEHVIVAAGGGVLCGLGCAASPGDVLVPPDVPAPFVDPVPGEVVDCLLDCYALGGLLRHVADVAGVAEGDPALAESLEALAERATHPDRARRPSARWLADALADTLAAQAAAGLSPADPRPPGPLGRAGLELDGLDSLRARRLNPRPRPVGRPDGPRRVGRRVRTRNLVVILAVVASGALALAGGLDMGDQADTATPDTATPDTATPDTPDTATPDTATPDTAGHRSGPVAVALPPGCPTVSGVLLADVDGDSCPDEVIASAGTVAAAGLTWEVGGPGDVVAVGDWMCSGTRTLAVLRPATGEVYIFTSWPGPDVVLEEVPSAVVEGGHALRAGDLDGDGCHELLVEHGSEGGPVAVAHRDRR